MQSSSQNGNDSQDDNSHLPRKQLQSDAPQPSGIDIRQAIDILSSRTPNDHTHGHASPELKSMGQTIDLFAPSSSHTATQTKTASTPSGATTTPVPADSAQQRQKIRESLKDFPLSALLKMVLTAQEDRVKTYRLYDEALEKVLVSKRLNDYPPACVAATAAFSVLSDTVTAVRDELSGRVDKNKMDSSDAQADVLSVISCIKSLQEAEKQKLQLTAAYHLEQIRANDLKQPENDNDDDGQVEVDMRELSLLNNGIADLRSQIERCRSNINDVLDDLRCALVEQMEDEEE